MSTVIDSVSIKGLRKTHFEQLLSYLKDRDNSGWYYGNKLQFEDRHAELEVWVEGVIIQLSQEGVRVAK